MDKDKKRIDEGYQPKPNGHFGYQPNDKENTVPVNTPKSGSFVQTQYNKNDKSKP